MPRQFPDDAKVTWAEGKLGPRGSAVITHKQRALVRTWLQGKLHASYAAIAGISIPDMTAAYNDTTDAKLATIKAGLDSPKPEPAPVPVPAETSEAAEPIKESEPMKQNGKEAPWGGPSDDVRQFFRSVIGPVEGRVNEADVRRIAAEVAGNIVRPLTADDVKAIAKCIAAESPERVIIVRESKPEDRKDLGVQHYKFPLLLRVLEAGMHAYLVGPAGTGKTTAAHQAEKALTLGRYECQSFYGTMTATTLLGYKDANGNYHETPRSGEPTSRAVYGALTRWTLETQTGLSSSIQPSQTESVALLTP